jgi:hypothetical protein
MAGQFEQVQAIADAIHATTPALRRVSTPHSGLLQDPILSPDLYPDDKAKRGYYVPDPPPPPFKVSGRRLPVLIGESGGRQWSVRLLVAEHGSLRAVPTLSISTYVRLVRDDAPPIPYLPWAVATAHPVDARAPGPGDPIDLAARAARLAVGTVGILSGAPPSLLARPPIRWPMLLASGDPAFRGLLDSPRVLALYQGWDLRAGASPVRPSVPVVEFLAEQAHFSTGLDLEQAPSLHAKTVQEVLALVPQLEHAVTGRDPELDPISTVRFTDPPGSVPDLRAGFRCPTCGRLEILKKETDRATGLVHTRTLNCGFDVFPPYPGRAGSVPASGIAAGRPPR